MISKQKVIENCLYSDLSNLISEFELGELTKEGLLNYFSLFMSDAKINSRITVNVLEEFGDLGKEEARNIKINEGW